MDTKLARLVPELSRLDDIARGDIVEQARYEYFTKHATWRTHLFPWVLLAGHLVVIVVAPMSVWHYIRMPFEPYIDILLLGLLVAVAVYSWSHMHSRWLSTRLAPIVREFIGNETGSAGGSNDVTNRSLD